MRTREWLAKPVAERGTPHTVVCGCGVDEFNYGIHAYAMLSGILSAGIRSVQHLGQGGQRRLLVTWQDGRSALRLVEATSSPRPTAWPRGRTTGTCAPWRTQSASSGACA
jgi:hypothetical protein